MDKVNHFHIPVNDMERAKEFYTKIFGWKIDKVEKDYQLVTTTELDENGIPKKVESINGALYQKEVPEDHVSVTINVPSINEYSKLIEESGGKVVTPKTIVHNYGFFACMLDTEGNIVGLWEDI